MQFKHFDHARRRLTVFTKGQKVREVAIMDPAIWHELERHILENSVRPDEYLIFPERGPDGSRRSYPFNAMSSTALHRWWYGCLQRAGVVEKGVTRGERMHKVRHTAGQRMLDHTRGNLKAVQMFLGHESIQTTADIYLDWDLDSVAEIQRQMAETESFPPPP